MKSTSPARGYALALFSRVAAAILGGYALTAASVIFLGALIPLPKSQAVLAASLASFAVYTAALVWAFVAERLRTLWLSLLLPAAVLAGLGLLLGGAGV
ncbi:hypothetical protein JQX08_18095 [Pseudomonas sp. UL073]|uniref:DUF3649 domain-containing protein n=1 Tax=Zestomonas insulae TaxID=2809017 RepID=A0ABS2IKZ0_9GAMM|nr:hypothetical protein [Pseudomonas insulae]MBM7062630.1 hypothetical protein [Pseudomonas insulae]